MGVGGGRPDIIATDDALVEVGTLRGASLDLVLGDTNDFQLEFGRPIPRGSIVFVEGTELAGVIDDVETVSTSRVVTHTGRTWPGILDTRVVRPPSGSDYYEFSGDANEVIAALVDDCDLGGIFSTPDKMSGIRLTGKAARYASLWEVLLSATSAVGARPSCSWDGTRLRLTAVRSRVVEVDAASEAAVRIRHGGRPVNHLVCLGGGELSNRVVIDLYADEDGNVSTMQSIFGPGVVEEVYDYSSADDVELMEGGTKRLLELQERSPVSLDSSSVRGNVALLDVIAASDDRTGVSATATVTRVVARHEDGILKVTYEATPTGTATSAASTGTWSGGEVPYLRAGEGVSIYGGRIVADVTRGDLDDVTETAESALQAAEDIPIVTLSSTNGTVFKRNLGVATTIVATVFTPGGRISTAEQLRERFGPGAFLEWGWRDVVTDAAHVLVSTDPRITMDGFALTVSPEDVDTQAVITCSLNY